MASALLLCKKQGQHLSSPLWHLLLLPIGHIPNTKIFINKIQLDELGYIVTDKKSHINVNGVFAAGDCQDHIFRQAITSAGSGCQAAMEAERYIEKLKADGKVWSRP